MLDRFTGRARPTRTERLFQMASLAVFLAVGFWSAFISYKPHNPQRPFLVIVGVGLGAMAASATIILGRIVAALKLVNGQRDVRIERVVRDAIRFGPDRATDKVPNRHP